MTAYNLGFAKQMNRAAEFLISSGVNEFDEAQAVAYMNLVAIEIAMKAALEKAGWEEAYLRRRSHDLAGLLVDICQAEILEKLTPDYSRYVSAAMICGVRVTDANGAEVAVGKIIDSESHGASKYPTSIRYGDKFSHYSPAVLTAGAKAVIDFTEKYWDSFRMRQQDGI